jgi:hypothetical protein
MVVIIQSQVCLNITQNLCTFLNNIWMCPKHKQAVSQNLSSFSHILPEHINYKADSRLRNCFFIPRDKKVDK